MSGLNAAPPLVVPGRRGRAGTWLRGRATPVGADRVHARRWAILAVLCLSVFLALIDNTIVNVALPSISKQLHATTSDLQWIVDAYSLVFASLLLVGGSLGDRYGRKGALQIGLAAFAGFSAFAGLAGSTHVLIIDAANQAFVAGLSRGSLVCAGVVTLGAVFAFLVLPRRLPDTPPSPPTEPGSKPGRGILIQLSKP
jgi:MFS family permease